MFQLTCLSSHLLFTFPSLFFSLTLSIPLLSSFSLILTPSFFTSLYFLSSSPFLSFNLSVHFSFSSLLSVPSSSVPCFLGIAFCLDLLQPDSSVEAGSNLFHKHQWSLVSSSLLSLIPQWNGLIDRPALLFMFPASEQSALPSYPLTLSLSDLSSPPIFLQVQVHSGVTSCLVAKDDQTPMYVTIINNSVALLTLFSLSLVSLNSTFPTLFLPFITVRNHSDLPCPGKTNSHITLIQKSSPPPPPLPLFSLSLTLSLSLSCSLLFFLHPNILYTPIRKQD